MTYKGARLKYWAWLIVAVLMLLVSRCSYAQNIGFESGNLTGWVKSGTDVTTSTGVNNVTYGDNKYWTITPYGSYMGQLYPSGSVTFSSTVTSLGLQASDQTAIQNFLNANSGGGATNPTNAAWIKRSVTLTAGVTYSFAWNYLSTDYVPFNDGSMITLVNNSNPNVLPTLNNLQQRFGLLGFTNSGSGNYSTGSYGSTGWQVATFTVPQDGEYTLGFATFNLGDTILSPMLFIDEIQGVTTLNGTTFEPVPPNAGSSAPATGGSTAPACPNGSTCSTTSFNANVTFNNNVNAWSQVGGSRVIIEQIGNYNSATVTQFGNKNYAEIHVNGFNNTTTVNQSSTSSTNANYIESHVSGNGNAQSLTQSSTGGAKGILINSGNDNNNITINQSSTGNHYAEITLSGGSKNVNLTQSGSAGHMAKIELTGGATQITATQTGSVQQFYSITHNCAQASCSAITVTQGQ